MRLIDADKLDVYEMRFRSALELQDYIESCQEEIVRCKDCKWCREHYDTDGNVPYWACVNWDGGTDADGYCHEGERR